MSIIIILFGLVFLWAGVINWRESREHFRRGQKTEAVIVALEDTYIQNTESLQSAKAYRAVYAYTDNDGNEHRMPGRRKSTRKGAFKIGARKIVYFDPDFPMQALDTPTKVFSSLTFALVAGVAMVVFGIAALVLDWDL